MEDPKGKTWTGEPETTAGGSEVIRHEPGEKQRRGIWGLLGKKRPKTNYLSEQEMDAISAAYEGWFGPSDVVMHEMVSDELHIDVVTVKPNATCPRVVAATMGMSALPMHAPKDYPGPLHAELFLYLPAKWSLTREAFEKHGQDLYWPIGWLKQLARMPNDYDTFLAPGHTVPNGDPPERLSERCGFVGFAIMPGPLDGMEAMKVGKREVGLMMVVPLFADEMQFKLDEGMDGLLDRFASSDVDMLDLADPKRPSVVKTR